MPTIEQRQILVSADLPTQTAQAVAQTSVEMRKLVADINMNIVGITDTQTLTNKTLTAPAVTGVTYANLPSSPVAGQFVYVTNSNTATWGANITSSGANKVLAFYNGTNWTVAGK